MKTASASVVGMTRNQDHRTSIAAAEKVSGRKVTIREQVRLYALSKPFGFTDDDLKAAFPGSPESSYRKRRTDLSDENIIVARGDEQPNRAGSKETVWTHRDHMQFPPPIRPRQAKPSRFALLQEENARLRAALATAIKVADEARDQWDAAPSSMRPGKLLIALSGHLRGYRADIDSIHAALAK